MKTGNFLAIGLAIAGVVVVFQGMKNKETKEAHVSPSQEQFVEL